METKNAAPGTLSYHLQQVAAGKRRFENAYQGVIRMILEGEIHKVIDAGKPTQDFSVFRQGDKHPIGMFSEINSLVSFVKDAAEGGSAKEMAFALVGEAGNGKTFLVEYLCGIYRRFLSREENRKYTFVVNLRGLEGYGAIQEMESQTFEDPMILAMNLFPDANQSKEFMAEHGLKDKMIEKLWENYRPLGSDTEYVLRKKLMERFGGDVEKILEQIAIVPVPMVQSMGIITGKYSAKDKITASAVDLLGEESIQRLLHITDPNNPYRFDLRRGALARVGGGGIHFSDEIFKNKVDLVQVYLGVIQNRIIDIDGFRWPIDTLIIATSNNAEFNRFINEKEQAPIWDRCRICYMSHNTDYKLQTQLTKYAVGSGKKTTLAGENMHEDPNLNYAASAAFVLSRLPRSDKLTPIETMKLAAGEIAGEKGIKTLVEVIDTLGQETDVTRRWGQKGLGHRNLGRALQLQIESSTTNEGKCMFAYDIFKAIERVILDYIIETNDRTKYLNDLKIAKQLYRERIRATMFNAYMDQPNAIKLDVLNYVNMIIAIDSKGLGPDKMWMYIDPQTKQKKAIKVDQSFVESVEQRMGKKTKEDREAFRTSIRNTFGEKMATDPKYDFMDNVELIKAVADVRLESDISGAGSLAGALANRTNEENQQLYGRMMKAMVEKLGYCRTCAEKTIELFCTKQDES